MSILGQRPRILLTGAAGQLGRHLVPVLLRHGELVTTGRVSGQVYCDLSEPGAVAELLDETIPDIIVNAAAWTAVDLAETETGAAWRMNRDLPAELARWCSNHERLLIHYSTDYVFSGRADRPRRETDPVAPESVYGQSKLGGEEAIAEAGCRAAVLRTAWLYSRLPGNFVSAILGRALKGENLRVVDDQTGSPTWAGHLAAATGLLLEHRRNLDDGLNLFHVADAGAVSWYGFARMVLDEAGRRGILRRPVMLSPIASDQWPQAAPRPAWSVLDSSRFEAFTGRPRPDIAAGLAACLAEWKSPAAA